MADTGTKLRLNINTQAIIKAVDVLSNTVLLTANIYLVGSGFRNHFRERKREQITNNFQTAAEIASALAGLTKVITETLGIRHAGS